MTARDWLKWLFVGALAGLLLGWLVSRVIAPPISSYALTLRDDPPLSDAVLGAGSLGVYIAEAPSFYANLHAIGVALPETLINAVSWALIGLTVAAFVMAVQRARAVHTRQARLAIGGIGGLLIGWMVPAVCQALGECFIHCYMHDGLLGDMALIGGGALRVIGRLTELPWRIFFPPGPQPTPPPVAMLVSAMAWAAAGVLIGAALWAAAHARAPSRTVTDGPDPEADRA